MIDARRRPYGTVARRDARRQRTQSIPVDAGGSGLPDRSAVGMLLRTITVTDAELITECDDGNRVFRRATAQPVRTVKAHRPHKADLTEPTTTPATR
ncbi:hypothetical protein [Dactylosporangium fulvum]|uniref:Uncharacterized protein n=1 Tax=Dactylosporangium fulvum TaxID=53359 RepID=A0ABY5VRT0_9ACTN|nr:hypothetical protein [Dactylosporangium fulvum]UWP79902.1 hypothetical protein Dfulv_32685 [Dactylosporangium fulvum]